MMTTALESRYNVADLTGNEVEDTLHIRFASQDRRIARLCLDEMAEAQSHVESFFEYSPDLKLFIFMYPTLSAMNQAFGRELPNENCCFVPIKGAEALITFVTPRNDVHSLKAMLVHEYCHIVFGSLTENREVGLINQRIPTWLDEGVALYVDREFRVHFSEIEKRRLDVVRRGADGWWPKLDGLHTYFNRLDGPTEFGPRGMLAYAYSYFCVKELITRFGRKAFVRFAASLAVSDDIPALFREAFQMPIGQFDDEMNIQCLELSASHKES